jgi:hypothetical protein
MYKLATIAFLVAALVGPASAAGKRAPVRPRAVQALCAQTVIIPPARGYVFCGGRFWVRDPETGKVKSIPFWRLQHMNDGPDVDRP